MNRYAGLHQRDIPADAIAYGEAKYVRCPDCGQLELWTDAELANHGQCRTERADCALCSEYDRE